MKGADDMHFLALQPHAHLHLERAAAFAGGESAAHLRHGAHPAGRRGRNAGDAHPRRRADGGQWNQAYDYFNRAWGNVLSNLQKRLVEGPIDWARGSSA